MKVKRWHILPCKEQELSALIRLSAETGRTVCHTWATPNGGLIWPKCAWVLPYLAAMRGERLTPAMHELCLEYKPKK